MQKFVRYYPDEKDRAAFFELHKFLGEHPTQKMAVSSNMSPLMDRANYEILVTDSRCSLNNNVEYIVFLIKPIVTKLALINVSRS